jgi:hypothetical protein
MVALCARVHERCAAQDECERMLDEEEQKDVCWWRVSLVCCHGRVEGRVRRI